MRFLNLQKMWLNLWFSASSVYYTIFWTLKWLKVWDFWAWINQLNSDISEQIEMRCQSAKLTLEKTLGVDWVSTVVLRWFDVAKIQETCRDGNGYLEQPQGRKSQTFGISFLFFAPHNRICISHTSSFFFFLDGEGSKRGASIRFLGFHRSPLWRKIKVPEFYQKRGKLKNQIMMVLVMFSCGRLWPAVECQRPSSVVH